MNITSQVSHSPLATVFNPQADGLRRENNQREVITQPAAASQSAAEKGVASDKDKAKSPTQTNELFDFSELQKEAEADSNTISEQSEQSEKEAEGKHQDHEHEQGEKNQHKDNPLEEFAEEQEIKQLQQRDKEVRSHELAHASVGGAHTGAPSYEFTIGPDGKKYATSGEVSVDVSTVKGDPQATIAKLQKVHAAALAPANPSVQDLRVAAQASRLILQAQSELLANKFDKAESTENKNEVRDNVNQSSFDHANGGEEHFSSEGNHANNDFDKLVNQTLAAQATILAERPEVVNQRATRIESFYSDITKAYDKAPSTRFQLTA